VFLLLDVLLDVLLSPLRLEEDWRLWLLDLVELHGECQVGLAFASVLSLVRLAELFELFWGC